MLPERAEEMLKDYKACYGRCGYLREALEALRMDEKAMMANTATISSQGRRSRLMECPTEQPLGIRLNESRSCFCADTSRRIYPIYARKSARWRKNTRKSASWSCL